MRQGRVPDEINEFLGEPVDSTLLVSEVFANLPSSRHIHLIVAVTERASSANGPRPPDSDQGSTRKWRSLFNERQVSATNLPPCVGLPKFFGQPLPVKIKVHKSLRGKNRRTQLCWTIFSRSCVNFIKARVSGVSFWDDLIGNTFKYVLWNELQNFSRSMELNTSRLHRSCLCTSRKGTFDVRGGWVGGGC
ncbi:hypothetical protein JG688_00011687 [Phytophthora aleatoria]|uniref:Uncharacterized protein n=1 Tax=Phytophthora aleatoria TaxID=2496075 RepID=A0A8J5IJV3_9STRA|nr:hypothetical protein JG688_00011687 [Phytophthora aleatoria]